MRRDVHLGVGFPSIVVLLTLAVASAVIAPVALAPMAVAQPIPAPGGAGGGPADPGAYGRLLEAAMRALDVVDAELASIGPFDPASDAIAFPLVIDGGAAERIVQLQRRSLRAEDFRALVETETSEIVEVEAPAPRTFRGGVDGIPGSRAAASIGIDGGLFALVDLGDATGDGEDGEAAGYLVIQPVNEVVPEATPDLHIVYRASDTFLAEEFRCGVADLPFEAMPGAPQAGGGAAPFDAPMMIAEIAFDADREFYQANGSSVPNTIADIENVMNGVTFIYERDVLITYAITTVLVRTSEPDPYSSSDPGTLLGQFKAEWNGNQTGILRDVAHLMTGRNLDGSVIGIAQLGVVCALPAAYGLSQSRFSSNLASRTALTAHELGHTWAANHCSGGDCRIMCPTLGGCTGDISQFGAQAKAEIGAFRDTRTCLEEVETPIPTPFVDTFPDTILDDAKWYAIVRAGVGEFALDEPTEPYALNLDAVGEEPGDGDQLRTRPLAASGLGALTVSYFTEARDVDPGESLLVEYFTSSGTWTPLETIVSDGTLEDHFRFRHHRLTGSGALHGEFRLRLRANVDYPLNDWFVDNVSIAQETISVALAPQSTSVAPGGQLLFDATLTNTTGQSQPADAWIGVYTPASGPLFAGGNPKFGPKAIVLNPSQSKTKPGLKINVPAGTTPGSGYRVVTFVGDFATGVVYGAGEFEFTVTP